MGGNTREAGRTTVSRVLAILGAFTSARPTLTLTELAEASDIPLATAHRLVAELIAWGALDRGSDGGLCIGMRLWHIGALAPQHRDLRSIAVPFMEDLYEATHENVQLAVRDGTQALCLDIISGRKSVPTVTEVGGHLPLHATAVGKVILAFSEPKLFETILEDGLRRCTPRSITMPGSLATALKRVREEKIAYSLEEMTAGACSIAAPIFDSDGALQAALAVVVHSNTDMRPLPAAVKTAAIGVTRHIRRPAS